MTEALTTGEKLGLLLDQLVAGGAQAIDVASLTADDLETFSTFSEDPTGQAWIQAVDLVRPQLKLKLRALLKQQGVGEALTGRLIERARELGMKVDVVQREVG